MEPRSERWARACNGEDKRRHSVSDKRQSCFFGNELLESIRPRVFQLSRPVSLALNPHWGQRSLSMSRIMISAVVALVAMSHPLLAADMFVRRAPVQQAITPPAYSWTGLYIGGHV